MDLNTKHHGITGSITNTNDHIFCLDTAQIELVDFPLKDYVQVIQTNRYTCWLILIRIKQLEKAMENKWLYNSGE